MDRKRSCWTLWDKKQAKKRVFKGFWDLMGWCETKIWCPGAESNHRHGDFQKVLKVRNLSINSVTCGACPFFLITCHSSPAKAKIVHIGTVLMDSVTRLEICLPL